MKTFPLHKNIFAGAGILLLILSCQPETKSTPETPGQTQQQQAAEHVPVPVDSLVSISAGAMRDLWENCDAVDIIFYENGFSLSQDEKGSIQNLLGYFLPTPVKFNPACKPIGRITFLAQGNIRQEADIYHGEECNYFVWIKNNRPAHINMMAPEGVSFFNTILKKGHDLKGGN